MPLPFPLHIPVSLPILNSWDDAVLEFENHKIVVAVITASFLGSRDPSAINTSRPSNVSVVVIGILFVINEDDHGQSRCVSFPNRTRHAAGVKC